MVIYQIWVNISAVVPVPGKSVPLSIRLERGKLPFPATPEIFSYSLSTLSNPKAKLSIVRSSSGPIKAFPGEIISCSLWKARAVSLLGRREPPKISNMPRIPNSAFSDLMKYEIIYVRFWWINCVKESRFRRYWLFPSDVSLPDGGRTCSRKWNSSLPLSLSSVGMPCRHTFGNSPAHFTSLLLTLFAGI